MVVQGTTLIVRIIATMFVLSPIVMVVMTVHVSDSACLGQVGSNILFGLEGVLNMNAGQRHDARRLGQQKEAQERRTKTS